MEAFMQNRARAALVLALFAIWSAVLVQAQATKPATAPAAEDRVLTAMHRISSHTLFDYVSELASEKYQGRLTGTESYNAAARWTTALLAQWKIKPAGDGGTYLQHFPNPYTLVLAGAEIALHVPLSGTAVIRKPYVYEKDFFPGSTSDSGEATAEVVYVGYGITAPELGYDEYQGVDVAGKIVLVEPEVPVGPDRDAELFRKWRPYSFHDYKVQNAKQHGAAGMIYAYHIANPNAVFVKGLLLTYVGTTVVDDIFLGTGKRHTEVVQGVRSTLKPASFATGKVVTMKNVTEHHPEGIGLNVVGYLEGSDPVLKREAIVIGAHLDHLGLNDQLMPGAIDNASGAAVLLGVAEALGRNAIPLKRSIVFVLFGAEEQGVKGSEYYVAHPLVPNDRVVGCVNLESVGRGERIGGGSGRNYPDLWAFFSRANDKYVHRPIAPSANANLARPRQDAAHFLWAGVPTISFGTSGGDRLPYATYHTTKDTPAIITPEIMEDLARIVFIGVVDLANAPKSGTI
jgi:hypothetical protein